MADPDIHPALVLGWVVDTVGTEFVFSLLPKVMHLDSPGFTMRLPLPTRMSEIPDVFLLFRIHQDHGLALPLELLDSTIDKAKLGISIRVIRPFLRFPVALEGVSQSNQEPIDGTLADVMPQNLEGVGQLIGALARPPERRTAA